MSIKKKVDKIPSNNDENSFLFSTSLIFDENIDKLWLSLKDLSAEVKYIEFLDKFKYIKGENTWTLGNIFSLYWVGVSNIKFLCVSINVSRMKKKIKWKCVCDIGISYYKTMILYRITSDDKTLVKLIFSRCEKNKLVDFNMQMQYYLNLQLEILNIQQKHLQSMIKEHKVFQSFITDKNYLKLWKFVTNLKNISILYPEIIKNIEYNGPYNEIGTFVKFYHCKMEKTFFFKLVEISNSNKSKTFKCRYEAVGTDIVNIPKIIEIQITIISPIKTYFSVFYIFGYKSNVEIINSFKLNLKNIINKILEYIKINDEEFKES